MTDLTVLISPTPLHVHMAKNRPFSFRRSAPCLIKPVMVTLETEREQKHEKPAEEAAADIRSQTRRRGRALSRILDPNLLSPPINTWKSSDPPIAIPTRLRRHRPTRSQSAPPARRLSSEQENLYPSEPFILIPPSTAIARSFPRRSFSSYSEGRTGLGHLLPPPPPLLRPTTFWRKTRRSGVTAASYSPSYHLIRRSTFIAAGLDFDTPTHDLSAFSVESRVGFIVVPPDSSLQ